MGGLTQYLKPILVALEAFSSSSLSIHIICMYPITQITLII